MSESTETSIAPTQQITREEAAERFPELPAEVAPVAVTEPPATLPEGSFGTEPVRDRTVDEQIKDLEAQLDALEAQRAKTAVSDMEFTPEVLAVVAAQRAKERFPNAQREVIKHLKQLAYSGERVAYLEPSSPIFNDKLVKWLVAEGFKAKIISLGANNGFKVEVRW